MNSGLYIIYSSLFTIFILSSCVLYILVVSDIVHAKNDAIEESDDTQNISDGLEFKEKDETKFQISEKNNEVDHSLPENEFTLVESLPHNSVNTDGLPEIVQSNILLEPQNLTKAEENLELTPNKSESERNAAEVDVETKIPLVVKVISEGEETTDSHVSDTESKDSSSTMIDEPLSIPETRKEAITEAPQQEEIPSFSEWAQKQLAEAEKQDTINNQSIQTAQSNPNVNGKAVKLRTKNYASPACGAKVIAYNSEAGSANSILSQNKDEYMLNTCNSKIWFVVELCEPIQAEKIELANFELFSSSPKDFAVYLSNRFPTREWTSVGKFTAKDERHIQKFILQPQLFGKFIKVEMLSHYGSEHYCPVSMFKTYGISEFEVLEKENTQQDSDDDDDEVLGDLPENVSAEGEHTKNLFGSARDAVISIVKKAAEALVKSDHSRFKTPNNKTNISDGADHCCSPSHIVVCDNCSETFYHSVFELISCKTKKLLSIVGNNFFADTFRLTNTCDSFGLNIMEKSAYCHPKTRAEFTQAVFPEKYITAFCNLLAIDKGKVVMNSSSNSNNTNSANLTLDKLSKEPFSEEDIAAVVELPFQGKEFEDKSKNEFVEKDNLTLSVFEQLGETIEASGDEASGSSQPVIELETVQNDGNSSIEISQSKEREVPIEIINSEKNDEIAIDSAQILNNEENNENSQSNETYIDSNNANNLEVDNFIIETDVISEISNTQPPMVNNQGQSPQSESVFMRLSNRVKALERNMSLSGQYLEELSRRYKKQVEEMQKSFDKSVAQMGEDKKKYEDLEQKYSEQVEALKNDIVLLKSALNTLTEEQRSWFGNITLIKFIILQIIILLVYKYYVKHRQGREPEVFVPVISVKKPNKSKKNVEKVRRKSVEGVSGHCTPCHKIRRPSEEALQIARSSAEESNGDEWKLITTKNKRRKASILNRTHPFTEMERQEWKRQDSIGVLQENFIPLDEQEFIAPVSEPKIFVEEQNLVPNGLIVQSCKAAIKIPKKRRLSSPAFLKSALSRQSSKSPSLSKKGVIINETDAAVSERSSSASSSPVLQPHKLNGGVGVARSESVSPLSKKKSIKSIFKKVYS